jgi:hypothetical protein
VAEINSNVTEEYLSKFDRAINISTVQKLTKWPFLQQLGYNGHMPHVNKDFHGLQDFKIQLTKYSNTHILLRAAWAVISQLVPMNASILLKLFSAPGLGQVGSLFGSLHSFGQVFGVSVDELKDPTSLAQKAKQFATSSLGTTISV